MMNEDRWDGALPDRNVRRCVVWYDKSTEFEAGEEELKGMDLGVLRNIFDVPEDDPMYECWAVKEGHAAMLQRHIEHPIELNKFDYFVEAYAVE